MQPIRSMFLLVLASLSCAARGQGTDTKPLFDASRHMRVSEVKPGMKGYGLSVFQDTKIERFEVEVISVLKDFNPKYDVVLIRCHGANLEHTGAIAGMSGSPIYLTDEKGHDRMIGAFAYGWPLMKDPIAGVQPIEYMLEVGSTLKPEPAATQQAGSMNSRAPRGLVRFDPLNRSIKGLSSSVAGETGAVPFLGGVYDSAQLQPLATPLMASGLSPKLLERFGPIFRAQGLVALQSGASTGASKEATSQPAELAPGSVLAAPLVTGDISLTAIGTCTEVIGDRVFGFGHPFNNEGPITLPMASGFINGVIPSISQSFKLGAVTQLRGTLIADQAVGVAGKLGKSPPTIPIDIHVIYTDGSLDETYHFDAAAHPRLTPILAAVAITSALGGRRDLPQYHTVRYDLAMEFANKQVVNLSNVAVNSAAETLLLDLASPASPVVFAAENPFERVMLKKISGTLRVTPEAHEADILSVNLPKMKYRPGETLHAYVRYRPFRAGEAILPIELPLPRDLHDGKYQLSICDRDSYLEQEKQARPFRFTAESIEDIFAVLKDVSTVRQDALYVRLLRQADGVAIGRTALPSLPSSRRQVMLDFGRSNVTQFVSAAVKIIPTETVMNGSADFEIEIDAENRVEGATHAGKADQHAPATTPPSSPGGVKPKPAPPKGEPPSPPEIP